MEAKRQCGCSGIRYCLVCEPNNDKCLGPLDEWGSKTNERCVQIATNKQTVDDPAFTKLKIYIFCSLCRRIHSGPQTCSVASDHDKSKEEGCTCTGISPLNIRGITVIEDFVTVEEEQDLITKINEFPWKPSQSGRRKQDFGPKANFKKKKLKIGNFNGLPSCTRFLVARMHATDKLKDFVPVEVCHLEYDASRGSSIDPHIDDEWLWGERLVTVNLSSSSFLCLTHDNYPKTVVKIPMQARSLIILEDEARHLWKHSILREDIKQVRIAITFRELTPAFECGGQYEVIGNEIKNIAKSYSGIPQFIA